MSQTTSSSLRGRAVVAQKLLAGDMTERTETGLFGITDYEKQNSPFLCPFYRECCEKYMFFLIGNAGAGQASLVKKWILN